MKFSKLAALALVTALPLAAQQTPAAQPVNQDEGQKVVAVLNGETITKARLDALYERLGAKMRAQYESTDGKKAFLRNYLGKRLIVQEAMKAGFDKLPEVQLELEAAREAALFDRFVRDVVGAPFVTETSLRKFYDQNSNLFAKPERARARTILVKMTEPDGSPRSKSAALEKITALFADLQPRRPKPGAPASEIRTFANLFAEAARQASEDPVSGPNGGDLGWVDRGIDLDPTFAAALYALPRGAMSGVVETKFGYHLIFIEDKEQAGIESFEKAKPAIREFLLEKHMNEVIETLSHMTNDLQANSKVDVYPENIK